MVVNNSELFNVVNKLQHITGQLVIKIVYVNKKKDGAQYRTAGTHYPIFC